MGEGGNRSCRTTSGWWSSRRAAECREGWGCWAGRAPTPPGGLAEAAGAGSSATESRRLCWGYVEG